jgi:hypothetical protein
MYVCRERMDAQEWLAQEWLMQSLPACPRHMYFLHIARCANAA